MKNSKISKSQQKVEKTCANSEQGQLRDEKTDKNSQKKEEDKNQIIKEESKTKDVDLCLKKEENKKDLFLNEEKKNDSNIPKDPLKITSTEKESAHQKPEIEKKSPFSSLFSTIPKANLFEGCNLGGLFSSITQTKEKEKTDKNAEETKKETSSLFGPNTTFPNFFQQTGSGIFGSASNTTFPISNTKDIFANLQNSNNPNKSDEEGGDDNDDEPDPQKPITWESMNNTKKIEEVPLPKSEFKKIFELKISKLKIDNSNRGSGTISIEEPIENKKLSNILVFRNYANSVMYQGFIIKKLSKIKVNPKSKPDKCQAELWTFSRKVSQNDSKVKPRMLDIGLITFNSEEDKKNFISEFSKLIDQRPQESESVKKKKLE